MSLLLAEAETFVGIGDGSLKPLAGLGSGTETFIAAGNGSFKSFTGTGAGTEAFDGSASGSLQSFTGSGSGSESFVGAGSGSLKSFTGSGSANESFIGSGIGNTSPFVASGSGIVSFAGAGTGTLQPITGAGTGTETFSGAGAGSTKPFTGSGSGTVSFVGIGSGAMRPLEAIGAAEQSFVGAGTCDMVPFDAAAVGHVDSPEPPVPPTPIPTPTAVPASGGGYWPYGPTRRASRPSFHDFSAWEHEAPRRAPRARPANDWAEPTQKKARPAAKVKPKAKPEPKKTKAPKAPVPLARKIRKATERVAAAGSQDVVLQIHAARRAENVRFAISSVAMAGATFMIGVGAPVAALVGIAAFALLRWTSPTRQPIVLRHTHSHEAKTVVDVHHVHHHTVGEVRGIKSANKSA